MKIGYPCINRSIGCTSGRTFRLKNYSDERMAATVEENLRCLSAILRYNAAHGICFFRITSDLIPFASHPVCTFDWSGCFAREFRETGDFINSSGMRISMHPDQFVILNSRDEGVHDRSVAELMYHVEVLDAMGLDESAKIQIHLGGVYGDKEGSLARFISRYGELDGALRKRLVIENDDVSYTVADCLRVHAETGIPVLFDYFHHRLNCLGEGSVEVLGRTAATWRPRDGIPMIDYSSGTGDGTRKHAASIDGDDFRRFLAETEGWDFDVMLEIKDKEASALKAVELASRDPRFIHRSRRKERS